MYEKFVTGGEEKLTLKHRKINIKDSNMIDYEKSIHTMTL